MQYVFVDMDGVIAEYGYPSGLYDGDFQKGNYLGKKPINTIITEILNRYNKQGYIIMICSASPNSKATLEKNDWLNIHFGVPYENRIFIGLEEDKIEAIRYYIEDLMHGNVQEHAIVIDDKGSILAKAHSLGIECYHPTQLLARKEMEDAEKAKDEPLKETEPSTLDEIIPPTQQIEYLDGDEVIETETSPKIIEDNDIIDGQLTMDDLEQTEGRR